MAERHFTLGNLFEKNFLGVLVIVVNAFSWYFPLYVFFISFLEKSQVGFSIFLISLGLHYMGVISFALIGTIVVKKLQSRTTFLCLWILIGVIFSAMILLLDARNTTYLLSVSFLLGISLGLGFPSCLSYLGDNTFEENRGRFAGVTFFASCLCMLLVGFLVSMSSFVMGVMILTIWRGLGLVLFLLTRPKQEREQGVTDISYRLALADKSLVLYLVPWIMFCLINFLEFPIVINFFGLDFAFLITLAEYGVGGLSALVGGWFADSIGRKRIVIFGFITLGIGYAVLGLFSNIVFSWYLFALLDGIAWGIFSLMFYLVIWADLARNRSKEKYYLIGVLPFIVSGYIQVLFTPYAQSIPISVAFSLASFFLFLAVLPLLYAPETLSEKEIEKKRLQKYLGDVEKVKKKYEK